MDMKDYEKYAKITLYEVEALAYWECDLGERTSKELIPLAIYVIKKQIDAIQGLTNTDTLEIFYEKAIEYLKT